MSEVREGYVKSPVDDTRIWYRFYPAGEEPVIIFSNGIACDTSYWRYLVRDFEGKRPMLIWDYRGHGNSDLPEDFSKSSMDILAQDLHAIVEELDLKNYILVGHSMGVQFNFEYYKHFPEKVVGLVPILGTYGYPFRTFFDTDIMEKAFPYIYPIMKKYMNFFISLIAPIVNTPIPFYIGLALRSVNPCLSSQEKMKPYFEHLAKLNWEFAAEMFNYMAHHTTEDILPEIKPPVLIIAGENDTFTPLWLSQKMKDMIPTAEMIILEKGSHAALVEYPDLIHCKIKEFINERVIPYMKEEHKILKMPSTTKRASSKPRGGNSKKKNSKRGGKK